ncbi:phage antirepressor protein, partial [Apilactobacillus micheneri]
MNVEPMKFNFKGNDVRSKVIDNKPYFVAKDVALAIGYKDTTSAIKKHIKNKYKVGGCRIATPSGIQEMTMISEPGIYQLAGQSKLPQAEPFQDWIFEEVLPSINHTGKYDVKQSQQVDSNNVADILSDPDNLLKLVTNYKDAKDEVKKLKPKAKYYDHQLSLDDGIKTSVIAQNYSMSAVKFNRLLHNLGVQYKVGKNWLLYKKYQNHGYIIQREFNYTEDKIATTMLWTPKGKKFIYNLLKDNGIVPEN